MSDLYTQCMLNYTTSILPSQINRNIDKTIEKRIKNEMEGKCINDGYVKKGSIKVISRSTGRVLVSQFNGSVVYNVRYSADICNPLEGALINAKVININKMGILLNGGDDDPSPLQIIMAKQHHINNEVFEKLKVGDKVKVKVLGKRFEFGDTSINVIGVLDDSKDIEVGIIKYYNGSKEYKWLSNFNEAQPFEYLGRMYPTVEHAFNAQKSDNEQYKDAFTIGMEGYLGSTASKARTFGDKKNMDKLDIEMVDDWSDDTRLRIMEEILDSYYNKNKEMKQRLIQTGTSPLIHQGFRVDNFWGLKKNGDGENHHGKILMHLREKYMEE